MKEVFCDGGISHCFRVNKLQETNRWKFDADKGTLTLWTEDICNLCGNVFLKGQPTKILDVMFTPWNHMISFKKQSDEIPELKAGISGVCEHCDTKHFKVV